MFGTWKRTRKKNIKLLFFQQRKKKTNIYFNAQMKTSKPNEMEQKPKQNTFERRNQVNIYYLI